MSDKELIVIMNGCTDGTKEYLQTHPEIIVREFEKPLGFAGAYNEGIKIATWERVILLNNDTILLQQEKDAWITMLSYPFIDPTVWITGPLISYSPPADRWFIIFFCVMIRRELFDKIWLLSEEYNPGGGEDTEFCIEAEKIGYKFIEVPTGPTKNEQKFISGGFPIYHKGEATVHDDPEWETSFTKNGLILMRKYNYQGYKFKLMNNFERAIFGKDELVSGRELVRYMWASQFIKTGDRVLEIGCSNGYGTKLLPNDIKYRGVDYDEAIIEEAKRDYWDENHQFLWGDVSQWKLSLLDDFDVIIAFEVLEHLDNGKTLAQGLKTHCKTFIWSVPYMETPWFWWEHHKLHKLNESDFPDFEYTFMWEDGSLIEQPYNTEGRNLMLMKWQKES